MSELYVIGYPDVATAQQVRDRLVAMQSEELISLADIVVVENRDGKIKLHQARNLTGVGAAGGALWGGLIGLIFFMPLVGAAVGAGAGALAGNLSEHGIDDNFMRDLGNTLEPGAAAVFMLVNRATTDRVITELTPYGGKLLRTSLSHEAEEHLRETVASVRGHAAA